MTNPGLIDLGMTNLAWEMLSDQAMTATGVVYFLALVAHSAQWALLARLPADEAPTSDRSAVLGRFGLVLTAGGAAIHLVGLVGRGMAADPNRVPWGNMYEFTISGVFVVVALYLALYRRYGLAWMAPWVVGFAFVILMLAMIVLHERVAPLTEALSSPWLVIHVISAIVATGIFSLGGIVSVLFLVKARSEARVEQRAPHGLLARIPAATDLDRLAYRLHAFAFPIWTFAVLISGPIWAHEAWARYWGWDPKEVWAFITWVVYAAYLHARATAGWRGRNAAIIALIGLGTLWFNFIGINYFFGGSSQHSYAAPAVVLEQLADPAPSAYAG